MKIILLGLSVMVYILSGFFSTIQAAETEYQLSTHILDISRGRPAEAVRVELSKLVKEGSKDNWQAVGDGVTDKDGRIKAFLPQVKDQDNSGIYKLRFLTLPYFTSQKQASFYPFVEVVFTIEGNSHYHVPITLSNYGYSTYRGS
ncbi:MAG: hydroxyisourate hydrolase [Enterobacteriaceae bacterium]